MTFTYLTNVRGGLLFNGLVHQKMKMVIITPPCCSRPIQTLLISGTKINIFNIVLISVLHCQSGRPIFWYKWRLHTESDRMIWNRYGRAVVDLFATSENTHCPRFFSLSHSPLVGDALTSHWPAAKLYAFPPIKILPLVLCKIREERASVLLIAPNWPNQPWFPDLMELLVEPPWPIPIRKDMLSQVDGSVWHPNPEMWSLHVWPLQGY